MFLFNPLFKNNIPRIVAAVTLGIAGLSTLPGSAGAMGAASAGATNAFIAAAELHAHAEGGSAGYWITESLVYGLRAVYFGLLLATAGTMLTFLAVAPGETRDRQREWMKTWLGPMSKTLLLAVLLHVFVQSNRIAQGLDGGLADWLRVFTETSSGQAWLVLLALAAAGPAAVRLPDIWKGVWALLLIAAESFVGHPAASEKLTLAVLSDFVHLACSSVWVSGVILLLLFWKFDRKEAGRFSETFSRTAWVTIVILTVTGATMAWLLLPEWTALWRGVWGRWLLVKSALVLLVILLGAVLRRSTRRGELPRGKLLKLDGLLMALILVIVAVFTTISPAPPSHPVNYHQMGSELHFTIKIEPNETGPNDVALQIWLPEAKGEPAGVEMELFPAKEPGETIGIRLERRPPGTDIPFPGYNEYRYVAKDAELAGAGDWAARMVVRLGDGTELEREITFKLGY